MGTWATNEKMRNKWEHGKQTEHGKTNEKMRNKWEHGKQMRKCETNVNMGKMGT